MEEPARGATYKREAVCSVVVLLQVEEPAHPLRLIGRGRRARAWGGRPEQRNRQGVSPPKHGPPLNRSHARSMKKAASPCVMKRWRGCCALVFPGYHTRSPKSGELQCYPTGRGCAYCSTKNQAGLLCSFRACKPTRDSSR